MSAAYHIRIRAGLVLGLLATVIQAQAQIDCLGVDGGTALPGTPCDDGLTTTGLDHWTNFCQCAGYCESVGDGSILPGSACDDANALTINDWIDGDCVCHGYCVPFFGQPGDPCDDGDPLTFDDVVDAWGCSCNGWSHFLSGQVFLDLDMNGMFDGADLPIQNRTVHVGPGSYYTSTDVNGEFSFRLWWPAFYTPAAASGSFDAQALPVAPVDLTAPGSSVTGIAIAMNPTALQTDLSVQFTSGPARPGFSNSVNIICRNTGTVATGGTLSFTFDPQQTILDQNPVGSLAGSTIMWTVPLLQLGETYPVEVRFGTPVATPLGTLLAYSALVQTIPLDAIPANDQYDADLTVVGSFDPNDIQVTPAVLGVEDIAAGTPVAYTIRFQNTGTYLAENVRIMDVLPFQLRPSSFEFVGSSHPCHAQLSEDQLEFRFDQIMLPDSNTNEPASHGFVMFRITPHSYLLPGSSVNNNAAIYFDFNEPIITNDAVFEVELNTGVMGLAQAELQVWPNPALDVLNLEVNGEGAQRIRLTIIDHQGRVVQRMDLALVHGASTVPLSWLAAGLYMLRVESHGKVRNGRFLKSR